MKCMCVISALPSCYVQLECFPFKLYLIEWRPYEIYMSWAIEEIHPDLNKPDDPNVALGLKLALALLAYLVIRKYLGYKIGNELTKRD